MISHKTKRTLLFAVVFFVAMLPVYMMGLSRENLLLLGNVIVAFALAAFIAHRYVKIN